MASSLLFSPVVYFIVFIGEELVVVIVDEANKYVIQSYLNKPLDLTVPESIGWELFFACQSCNRQLRDCIGQLGFTWSSPALYKRPLSGSRPDAKLSQKCRSDIIASDLSRDVQYTIRGIPNDLRLLSVIPN